MEKRQKYSPRILCRNRRRIPSRTPHRSCNEVPAPLAEVESRWINWRRKCFLSHDIQYLSSDRYRYFPEGECYFLLYINTDTSTVKLSKQGFFFMGCDELHTFVCYPAVSLYLTSDPSTWAWPWVPHLYSISFYSVYHNTYGWPLLPYKVSSHWFAINKDTHNRDRENSSVQTHTCLKN